MNTTKAGALAIASVLLAGCQGMQSVPTEEMVVRQMPLNNVSLAYVEEGRGVPVVFVHGASGDWRSWEGLRPQIASRYRFVSISRRHHYPNPWPDDGRSYSIDQHVEDVAAFIRALNAGKVHLVGNSYGGRIAGYVALKYPELLRSVVLGEPSLVPPASAEGKAAIGALFKSYGEAGAKARGGDNRQAAMLVANAVLDDAEGFKKMTPLRQQRWLDNALTMAPMFAAKPPAPVSCEQARGLRVPALVLRGERTREAFRQGNEALLSCLPAAKREAVIPGASHIWPAENPVGGAQAILAFISAH